jgi:4-diphosphocytidyl-2-C-methyl-D-erythritol kinase
VSGPVIRAQAHAKINIRLKVLAREPNGFHTLETLFVRVALADTLTVRVAPARRTLDVQGDAQHVAAIGPVDRNLAFRAAAAYAEITGWPKGFAIELDKRVPVGGGLGGGSADAAAVLRALNALAPAPVSFGDLLRIAASLGADVPFLTTDHAAALAWGRGDRMLALPPLPEQGVALLVPRFSINTGEAYGWLDATHEQARPIPVAMPQEAFADWDKAARWAENDFEVPVIAHHPEIAEMLATCTRAGAVISRMSGSGSTVFGVFAAAPDPTELAGSAWEVVLTRTLRSVVQPERLD